MGKRFNPFPSLGVNGSTIDNSRKPSVCPNTLEESVFNDTRLPTSTALASAFNPPVKSTSLSTVEPFNPLASKRVEPFDDLRARRTAANAKVVDNR